MNQESKNPPIKKFRVGAVQANIWEETNDKGTFHRANFERSYKDNDGKWQSTNGFSMADMGALKLCAEMAEKFLAQKVTEAQA